MARRESILAGTVLLLLSLTVVSFAVSTTSSVVVVRADVRDPYDLKGKVKRLVPAGGSESTKGPPLRTDVVYPEDGATISQGTHRVLVSAYAKAGIAKVELKIDGPESVGWTEITSDFDGSHYYYDWTVSTDGAYTVTATTTDANGKSKKDSSTVYVGAPQPTRWAVVIGIADYEGRSNDLWHPDEDAKEMKSELVESGYLDANIRLLLNRKATAQAISDAIDWLVSNVKADDEVVFFFSGHGYRAPDDDWNEDGVPDDGWDGDIETDTYDEMIVAYDFYGLPDGWFREKFAAVESTKFALLFGSCHSGGMFDDEFCDLRGTGRVIASACKADQYGWDYLLLRNTLWGYYFVDEGLLDNNADSVETAHAYAYPRVIAEQPDSQPQLYDNFPGEFKL